MTDPTAGSQPDESTQLQIQVKTVAPGFGVLEWSTATSLDVLAEAISTVSDDAIMGQGFRRLEVSLPASDRLGRRAVQRAGFRLEGVRRLAYPTGQDETGAEQFEDVALYARLVSDVVHGGAAFSSVMNSVLPRKRLIAHVIMRDDHDRFVLCETTFKPDWELPGGIVEPDESARAGAIREVREELGIDLAPGPVLVADWLPPYLGWEDAVELIFDGGRVAEAEVAAYDLDQHEIRRARLVTLAEAEALVTPLSHRRLSAALALPPGGFAYLEDGRRV